jgi:hypothetical protein
LISDEEYRARLKAFADATTVSWEQAARNLEANLPALREAFGMRAMPKMNLVTHSRNDLADDSSPASPRVAGLPGFLNDLGRGPRR